MTGVPDWHLKDPLSEYERANMREHILSVLLQQRKALLKAEIRAKLPALAARVEQKLLMQAPSKAEYSNRFTLDDRLRGLLRPRRRAVGKRQRPPSSSMSDGEGSAGKDQKKRAMALHYQYQLDAPDSRSSGSLVFQFSSDVAEKVASSNDHGSLIRNNMTIAERQPEDIHGPDGAQLGLSNSSRHPLVSKCYQLLYQLVYSNTGVQRHRQILEELHDLSQRAWIQPKLREAVAHTLLSAVMAARRSVPHLRTQQEQESLHEEALAFHLAPAPADESHDAMDTEPLAQAASLDLSGGVPERGMELDRSEQQTPANISAPIMAGDFTDHRSASRQITESKHTPGEESPRSPIDGQGNEHAPISLLLNFCADHFASQPPVHRGLLRSVLMLYKGNSSQSIDGKLSLPRFDLQCLQRCVDRFALADPACAFEVVTRLTKQWPVNDAEQQVTIMGQVESLLRVADIATCTRMISPVVHRLAKCSVHGNCTVALTAIGLAESILSIAERIPPAELNSNSPVSQARNSFIVLQKLLRSNRAHWHPAVVQASEDLARKLRIRMTFNGLPVQM